MLAAASEKINGIVNKMPTPESTQIAVIAMGRLEGEAGSDSVFGHNVLLFVCGLGDCGGHLGTVYSKSIGSASPSATTPCQG